jgi:hypothetical protein
LRPGQTASNISRCSVIEYVVTPTLVTSGPYIVFGNPVESAY